MSNKWQAMRTAASYLGITCRCVSSYAQIVWETLTKYLLFEGREGFFSAGISTTFILGSLRSTSEGSRIWSGEIWAPWPGEVEAMCIRSKRGLSNEISTLLWCSVDFGRFNLWRRTGCNIVFRGRGHDDEVGWNPIVDSFIEIEMTSSFMIMY